MVKKITDKKGSIIQKSNRCYQFKLSLNRVPESKQAIFLIFF
jgi:hypothetical protein